ncbi:hypothetical protein MAPG_07805 [Magnaporthiopsis poae ATCC 64411]|uniref:Pantothenate transporter liz1 n=1 Tax=Magnaporthiopsis poae (strain ATCC 64411 / 73-15) TaxID=644358 RepID=A0A0C4E5N2_MAGP6|nr:hypothetical protein MAPG_07805 [Magnaporthiopsis poae ATCC 64411]
MSPVVARAALRNMAQRRQFSLMTAMRTTMRSFEPHPFQRLPIAERAQPADWAKIVSRTGKSLGIYFPGMALILGWPFMVQRALDGHI